MQILKGYKTCKIKYGSISQLNPNNEEQQMGLSHIWKVYVKAPPGFIKSVTYKLHESFLNPIVSISYSEKNPYFELNQKGWGEFTIQIRIVLFNNDRLNFSHNLKLYETKKTNDFLSTNILINEKKDTIFFKGNFNGKLEGTKYECKFSNEEEEYKKIDKCIDYVLQEIDKLL